LTFLEGIVQGESWQEKSCGNLPGKGNGEIDLYGAIFWGAIRIYRVLDLRGVAGAKNRFLPCFRVADRWRKSGKRKSGLFLGVARIYSWVVIISNPRELSPIWVFQFKNIIGHLFILFPSDIQ
jgi:hypothetical protein